MAQNYTRQSTLSDGDTITASLFNDEYNQLVNAFTYSSTSASSTGHRHDGSAGQGGNIFKIGDLDFLNKIEVDSTNNRWGFYVEVSSAAVEQIRIQDGSIVPVTTNDIDLGTSSLQFKDLYINGTANVDSLTLTSGSTVTTILDEDDLSSDSATALVTQQSVKAYIDAQVTAQDLDFQADTGGALSIDLDSETMTFTGGTGIDTSGLGNAVTFAIDSTVTTLTGTQTLTNKTLTTPIISSISNTGTLTLPTSTDTLVGRATIDTLTNKTLTSPDINTPDIDGGTIDGATIATSDITVGTGKTLDVSSGTLTLADDQISGDKVEGGTIASTTITSLASTTVDTTNLEVTNIKAKDGTSAGSIANTTGVVTLASSVLTTTDINGGTIDGATIGGTTTAAGSFTSVNATSLDVAGAIEFDSLSGTGAVNVTDILDQDDMSSNSATALATQQSIKAYVDSQVATVDTLAEVLGNGNATGGTDIAVGTGDDITFADNSKVIFGAGSDLSVYSDGSDGILAATANLTLDVAGDINLDADGADINLKDGGTRFGILYNSSSDFIIEASVQDKDIKFLGNDGGSGITALRLDMSEAGAATFNSTIALGDNKQIFFGDGSDGRISFDGTNTLNITASNGTATTLNLTANNFTIGGASALISGTANDSVVINEASGDVDFRVESNAASHMLFLDAGSERLHVNGTTGTATFNVAGSSSFANTATSGALVASGATLSIQGTGTYNSNYFGTDRATVAIRSNEPSNDGWNPTLNIATIRQSLATNQNATGGIGFTTIDDSNNTGIDDAGRIEIANTNGASNISATRMVFYNNVGGSKTQAAQQVMSLDPYETILNEDSLDRDFRVESNSNTHMIFVDGGNDHVNIGTSADLTGVFNVDGNVGLSGAGTGSRYLALLAETNAYAGRLVLQAGGGSAAYGGSIVMYGHSHASNGGDVVLGISAGSGGQFRVHSNGVDTAADRLTIGENGDFVTFPAANNAAVFNQAGVDADFRVESDSASHMLFVDAGTNRVGINNSSPSTTFHSVSASTNMAKFEGVYSGSVAYVSFLNDATSATGNGSGLEFRAHTTTNERQQAFIQTGWTDTTDATRTSAFVINQTIAGAGREIIDSTGDAGMVINQSGIDYDFRVESNNDANAFVVNAGTDNIGMGTNNPSFSAGGGLRIERASTATLRLQDTGAHGFEIRAEATAAQFYSANNRPYHFLDSNSNQLFAIDSSGNITQTNYGAGAAAGPYLTLDRNSASPADSDLIGVLSFRGRDDGANATDYGTIAGKIADVTGGTEDGVMLFNVISGGSSRDVLTLSHNESVFNNGSADQDFRVESDSNANAFFLDAGSGNIGMGGTSNVPLNIFRNGAGNTELLRLTNNNTNNHNFYVYVNDDDNMVRFGSTGDNGGNFGILESTNTNDSIIFYTAGGATFNERGVDSDFRVESSNNSNMLHVDAGFDCVAIGDGTASSAQTLLVSKNSNQTEATAHLRIQGNGYSAFHWLDATAYYIGQNSSLRALRIYSSAESAGAQLSAGATSFTTFSDERIKERVEPVENALQSLSGLRTVKYHLKDVDGPEDKKKIGVIAQDLVGVLDEVIDPTFRPDDDTEYMGVRYTELVPVLIKAIQEQQQLIESLTARVAELESN